MPQRAATIESLPMAFEVVKAMQADGLEWDVYYRPSARAALAEVIELQMAAAVDRHLETLDAEDGPDRRNGHYRRHLLTTLGDIELCVPRTRRYTPTTVLRAYARRTPEIDRVILAGFVLGLSTRKVGEALLPMLGRPVSAGAVSQVAKTLDAAVAAFHRRPLKDRYKVLMLDGVVLARKTGAGALRRPVLVALGLLPDGRKEIIDFRLAGSESAAEWERFLTDLYRRGLIGQAVDRGGGWRLSVDQSLQRQESEPSLAQPLTDRRRRCRPGSAGRGRAVDRRRSAATDASRHRR
jgi:transposase-like protein